jgi:hypothetical protein
MSARLRAAVTDVLTCAARLFLSLFLFALYVAVNATGVPMFDAVGFNGVATARSVPAYGRRNDGAVAGVCVEPARGLKTPAPSNVRAAPNLAAAIRDETKSRASSGSAFNGRRRPQAEIAACAPQRKRHAPPVPPHPLGTCRAHRRRSLALACRQCAR